MLIPRLSFDARVTSNATLGGSVGYMWGGGSDYAAPSGRTIDQLPSQSTFVLAPRMGFMFGVGSLVAIWLRLGVTYHDSTVTFDVTEQKSATFATSTRVTLTSNGAAFSLDPCSSFRHRAHRDRARPRLGRRLRRKKPSARNRRAPNTSSTLGSRVTASQPACSPGSDERTHARACSQFDTVSACRSGKPSSTSRCERFGHRIAPGFGHALLMAAQGFFFESLGVSAAFWLAGDDWFPDPFRSRRDGLRVRARYR